MPTSKVPWIRAPVVPSHTMSMQHVARALNRHDRLFVLYPGLSTTVTAVRAPTSLPPSYSLLIDEGLNIITNTTSTRTRPFSARFSGGRLRLCLYCQYLANPLAILPNHQPFPILLRVNSTVAYRILVTLIAGFGQPLCASHASASEHQVEVGSRMPQVHLRTQRPFRTPGSYPCATRRPGRCPGSIYSGSEQTQCSHAPVSSFQLTLAPAFSSCLRWGATDIHCQSRTCRRPPEPLPAAECAIH